ncbi:hypothetical protein X011_16670 [Mycobacterium tuberculosis variant microti OV254]|nr:hypothetical protein X011_16670 [Mycobacterium tuberculosis variant microti OV254]
MTLGEPLECCGHLGIDHGFQDVYICRTALAPAIVVGAHRLLRIRDS